MFFMFLLDYATRKFYWYYTIWWFDMPMHFLGGIWVSLFFIYVFFRNDLQFRAFGKVIFWVAVIGILWEGFEIFVNQHLGRMPFNALDSALDLALDLVGALVGVRLFKKIILTPKSKL